MLLALFFFFLLQLYLFWLNVLSLNKFWSLYSITESHCQFYGLVSKRGFVFPFFIGFTGVFYFLQESYKEHSSPSLHLLLRSFLSVKTFEVMTLVSRNSIKTDCGLIWGHLLVLSLCSLHLEQLFIANRKKLFSSNKVVVDGSPSSCSLLLCLYNSVSMLALLRSSVLLNCLMTIFKRLGYWLFQITSGKEFFFF